MIVIRNDESYCASSPEWGSSREDRMKPDHANRPDRFELEAAARRHRAEAWTTAFEATAHWIRMHLAGTGQHETATSLMQTMPRRAAH